MVVASLGGCEIGDVIVYYEWLFDVKLISKRVFGFKWAGSWSIVANVFDEMERGDLEQ